MIGSRFLDDGQMQAFRVPALVGQYVANDLGFVTHCPTKVGTLNACAERLRSIMKTDVHTHYYPENVLDMIRIPLSDFSFAKDPTGPTIIAHRGEGFFGVPPPMTDVNKRLE